MRLARHIQANSQEFFFKKHEYISIKKQITLPHKIRHNWNFMSYIEKTTQKYGLKIVAIKKSFQDTTIMDFIFFRIVIKNLLFFENEKDEC